MTDFDELDEDDYPSTHLDDDAYDEFIADEFTSDGRIKRDPPIALILVAVVVVLLVVLSLLV